MYSGLEVVGIRHSYLSQPVRTSEAWHSLLVYSAPLLCLTVLQFTQCAVHSTHDTVRASPGVSIRIAFSSVHPQVLVRVAQRS